MILAGMLTRVQGDIRCKEIDSAVIALIMTEKKNKRREEKRREEKRREEKRGGEELLLASAILD